jgi:hypothetical protein
MAETGTRPRSARTERRYPVETKPFFMTSEFAVLVLMTVCLFIASAVVDDVDARLAWILGSSLVGAYIVSRGIAKSGTKSRSYDPREDLLEDRMGGSTRP